MVEDWVKEIVNDVLGPSKMAVGQTLTHPDGRMVYILSGQYWGEHGLSNFWSWQEVKPDGSVGPKESGYGWC